jgi:indole-3-glycerol phosphate synthase
MLHIQRTGTLLDEIVTAKIHRLSLRQPGEDPEVRYQRAKDGGQLPVAADFAAALRRPGEIAIIAEIKRASPSKGLIAPACNIAGQALAYAASGAAAISVLTEEDFFAGSGQDLCTVAQATRLPVLCKDFIVESGQIYEARLFGASAVLLIAALFDEIKLRRFIGLARELGLAALVEVHDLPQLLAALAAGAMAIGINNRDLRTFEVDLGTVERLAGLIPHDRTIIAESGIATSRDLARAYRAGAHAALIGEMLMRLSEPAAIREKFRELACELPGIR